MKKILLMLGIFMTSFVFVSNSLGKADTCILDVRVTNLPPLYFQDESGKWTGLTVDLAKVLLTEAGCEGDFRVIPWARSLKSMGTGSLDMMMNLTMTEERKEFINFIGPQIDETANLIIRKEIDVDIQSLDDIKKLPGKIGYQRGTFLGNEFEKKLKFDPAFKNKFEIIHSDELNIKKLRAGRIIGFIEHTYSGITSKKEIGKGTDFKIHPFVIYKNPVYFGFSKKAVSKELLVKFQKAYDKAKSEGKFEKVLNRYK